MNTQLKMIDLFSGTGAFSQAFQRSGNVKSVLLTIILPPPAAK